MVEKRTYDYSGEEVEPNTDTMYVKTGGTVLHFKDLKTKKDYLLGCEARNPEQTEASHCAGGKTEDNQMSDTKRAFVMVRPDGVQRGFTGDIVPRFEDRDLKMVADKFMQISEELVYDHYGEHEGKPPFEGLIDFITSGPVFAMVWEGQGATRQVRRMVGEMGPAESAPGTVRGDYDLGLGRNIIHGSDHGNKSADKHGVVLFFDEDKLADYEYVDETWLYE